MKEIRLAIVCFLGLPLLSFAAEPPAASVAAKVDAYVRPFVESNNFSGAILIARRGKLLVRKGYGLANQELGVANTPGTKFQIASLSKPFTVAAILLLEERGKLSISDPITRFIPDYPGGDKITLHHLLAHTSGIPNANSQPEYDEKSRFPQTLEQVIALFKQKPLRFTPGEKFEYSNSNYNLLAFVIEKASGESFGDFLRKNIFEPLGMNGTGQPRTGELLKGRASGYSPAELRDVENAPYLDWSIKTGNGSLYSTVDDLYRFDRALSGDKLLTQSSREKMFTAHTEGVGYGWFLRQRFGRKTTAFGGRSPGFTSSLERYVDDDVCIVLTSNIYSSIGQNMAQDLAAIVFGEKYNAPRLTANSRLAAAVLDRYAGRYRFGQDFAFNPGASVSVERVQDALVMRIEKGGGQTFLLPQSETSFLDRSYGGRVNFVQSPDGSVTHLTWSFGRDYTAQRVP